MSFNSVMHDPIKLQRFCEMWKSGVQCDRMAVEIGLADDRHVREWRKKLGLPERGENWMRGRRRPPRRK